MKIIEVEDVIKSFKGRQVLNQVSLSIEKGTICGLVGRNGSGKTVLMKCICGFLTPDSGMIRICGKEIGRKTKAIDNMGIIIETPGFLEAESGKNNLMYLAKLNGKIGEKQVSQYIRLVGLDPEDKKKVKNYSMGMKQRLGIAQAIMENPDIIILDEPMNGLDEKGVEEMRKIFLSLKKDGKTILIASHNQEDINSLCDKVYRMDGGYLEERI
ncbi:MAG: ATP-binding cassette domain-containing protein [Lachnospiraceae bacterium]|nr:ATP-binding cassette domain-containing protein [Lachnospiraceae bacterium]